MEYGNFVPHTCRSDRVSAAAAVDVVAEMQSTVDELARSDASLSAATIWTRVNEEFYGADQAVVGLSREQVLSRTYRVRDRHFGGNIHGRIELPPLSRVRDRALNFFQFHHISGFSDTDLPSRVIGWAHPELIALLRYSGTSIFMGGTFRCVPRGFQQSIVLMVHDRSSGYYIPVFYVLTTHRTIETYNEILHLITQATDRQLDPSEFICDFERALIDVVGTAFPNADVIGCFFHFKQAVRRRMKKLGISSRAATIAMTSGVLDMLAVVPIAHIEDRGIPWVKQQIKICCRTDNVAYVRTKWKLIWAYFIRTWLKLYDPVLWNVHGLNERLVARTNNPLERFNRELNGAFSTPHPTLSTVVATIESLARGHVASLAAVRGRRARRRPRETIRLPDAVELPEEAESSSEDDASHDESGSEPDNGVSEPGDGRSDAVDGAEEQTAVV